MSNDRTDIIYYLNEADEIVTVNCAWNRFARENDALDALGPHVQWRPVWAFISDGTTSLLCRRLLRRAREGRTVDFCMRCDAPSKIRLVRMRIQRQHMGLLEICVRTVASFSRNPVPFVPARNPNEGNLTWCSWCQRIEPVPGEWVEAEDMVNEFREIDWTRPLAVRPGSCPQCVARMAGIADSTRDVTPAVPAALWPPHLLDRTAMRLRPPQSRFASFA